MWSIAFLFAISLPHFTSGFFFDWLPFGHSGSNKNRNPPQLNEGYSFHQRSTFCPPLRLPDVKYFQRNYSYGTVAPDNYAQQGILTNNKFPAEHIIVHQGDTVIVEVCNHLASDHPLTIHFHGILQKFTTRSDGVPYVTQDPIPYNSCYHYIMNIGPQVGTFIYHAHTNLDLIWAYGAFIIDENPNYIKKYQHRGLRLLKSIDGYKYDEERIITLSQCWHTPISKMYDGLFAAPFQDVPDTDSILINGKSFGMWEKPSNGNSSGLTVITVEKGKCYRFRIIGIGSDSMIKFSIFKHSLRVIETDGIIIDPVWTDYVNVNSAQRYSCIVCMNEEVANYAMSAVLIPGQGPKNGVGVLHYEGAPDPTNLFKNQNLSGQTDNLKLNRWVLDKLHPSSHYRQLEVYRTPMHVDKTIIIRSYEKIDEHKGKHFLINRHYVPTPNKNLMDIVQKTKQPFPPSFEAEGILDIPFGEDIQIVFINLFGSDGECEQHPWHLHGHLFYIVGEGPNDYRQDIEGVAVQKRVEEDYRNGERSSFQFRDVLTLFPSRTDGKNEPGTPCGWIAIRFKADNPGMWLVHCHLTAHMIMGKRFVMYEHTKEDPRLQQQCYFDGIQDRKY